RDWRVVHIARPGIHQGHPHARRTTAPLYNDHVSGKVRPFFLLAVAEYAVPLLHATTDSSGVVLLQGRHQLRRGRSAAEDLASRVVLELRQSAGMRLRPSAACQEQQDGSAA